MVEAIAIHMFHKMEVVVAVAIGVLTTVFVGSLVALIIVLRHKYCHRKDLISAAQPETRPDVRLVGAMEVLPDGAEVELDEVRITPPQWEDILQDEEWVDDASGVVPHCIEILKICHLLTEKLVAITMRKSSRLRSPETLTNIIEVAKRISPRIDDVVTSMYPPMDPKLLEARCTALVLSVSHLALVTKNACRMSGVTDWIDKSLADVEEHLLVLREASIRHNVEMRIAQSSNMAAEGQQAEAVMRL